MENKNLNESVSLAKAKNMMRKLEIQLRREAYKGNPDLNKITKIKMEMDAVKVALDPFSTDGSVANLGKKPKTPVEKKQVEAKKKILKKLKEEVINEYKIVNGKFFFSDKNDALSVIDKVKSSVSGKKWITGSEKGDQNLVTRAQHYLDGQALKSVQLPSHVANRQELLKLLNDGKLNPQEREKALFMLTTSKFKEHQEHLVSIGRSLLNEKLVMPNKGEEQDDFISRFMSSKQAKVDFPNNKQRLAVAFSQWERKNKKKNLSESLFKVKLNEKIDGRQTIVVDADSKEEALKRAIEKFNISKENISAIEDLQEVQAQQQQMQAQQQPQMMPQGQMPQQPLNEGGKRKDGVFQGKDGEYYIWTDGGTAVKLDDDDERGLGSNVYPTVKKEEKKTENSDYDGYYVDEKGNVKLKLLGPDGKPLLEYSDKKFDVGQIYDLSRKQLRGKLSALLKKVQDEKNTDEVQPAIDAYNERRLLVSDDDEDRGEKFQYSVSKFLDALKDKYPAEKKDDDVFVSDRDNEFITKNRERLQQGDSFPVEADMNFIQMRKKIPGTSGNVVSYNIKRKIDPETNLPIPLEQQMSDPDWDADDNYISPEEYKKLNEKADILKKHGVEGFNKPKRTPSHKTKSHLVVAKKGDKIKVVRFGAQGVKGSPKKDGESESYRKRREGFRARHRAQNPGGMKDKFSALYWANKEKW